MDLTIMHKLLLIDDDPSILRTLHRLLKTLDAEIFSVDNPNTALTLCSEHQFKLIISDQRMPVMEGTTLLKKITKLQPTATRIILSAYSDFDAITDAFNHNIIDKFIAKPWDNHELLYTAGKILEEDKQPPVESQQEQFTGLAEFHGIYTQCDRMLDVFDLVKRIATANVPVNIFGHTGTGKELIARALHQEGARQDKKFIAINCANLSPELAESQLFGHLKGAFTGATSDKEGLLAAADGGTLFMDEVTCLPPIVQSKLLRALQEQEFYKMGSTTSDSFDVQIISASSTALKTAVDKGEFRADLRFRLEVIPLELPDLKERGDDIIQLFLLFLRRLRNSGDIDIEESTQQCLFNYPWPGNIRELYNAAAYAHAITDGNTFEPSCLPLNVRNYLDNTQPDNTPLDNNQPENEPPENEPPENMASGNAAGLAGNTPSTDVASSGRKNVSKEMILSALENHGGNRSSAASALGVSRMTLWRHMKQHGITE